MSDLQRVPAPRLPFARHGEIAALGLLVIVAALIVKPWGATSAALDAGPRPTASPAATPAPTAIEAGYAYDQSIFGPFEPNPEWSIWPAGFFVTVLYVTRESTDEVSVPVSPAPTGTESPAPTEGAGPVATSPPATGWPEVVTIGPGDHLLWLGINTPIEVIVREARVWREDASGLRTEVPIVRLPSIWGPHFTIVGIPAAAGSERLAIWAQGRYDVEVTLDPGAEKRSIRVEIQTLAATPTEPPDDHPR
jgi:hypothetical protein